MNHMCYAVGSPPCWIVIHMDPNSVSLSIDSMTQCHSLFTMTCRYQFTMLFGHDFALSEQRMSLGHHMVPGFNVNNFTEIFCKVLPIMVMIC